MELQRQVARCLELRVMASRTLNHLEAIRSSCHYPHLLSTSILNDFDVTVAALNAIDVDLYTLEQTGAPDSKQVGPLALPTYMYVYSLCLSILTLSPPSTCVMSRRGGGHPLALSPGSPPPLLFYTCDYFIYAKCMFNVGGGESGQL